MRLTLPDDSIVVFDVGNVLIEWDPRHLFRKIFADEARMEHFLAHVCTMAWNLEQDRGRSWAEAVAELTARHPEWQAEIQAYDQRWDEMVVGPIAEPVAVLAALKTRGRPVYAITNFSLEKWARSQARFPFLRDFDGVVVSAEERLVKPQREIYERLLTRHGLSAAQCVFIDDAEQNILAARALGMRAIHFQPGTKLGEELRAYGVEV